MAPPEQQPKGLEWVPTPFSLEPRWTTEIDTELIKRAIEATTTAPCLEVKFLAQGAFNKIYTVRLAGSTLVMRVSLPVDPEWKTASEVATMEWIHYNTALPVPKVLAYQNNQDNVLGFEWILMTQMPGATLSKAWRSIDMEAKRKIVDQFALFASVLFKNQLRGIGNIFLNPGEKSHGKAKFTQVGRIISMHFFWGSRLQQSVPRGPFRSSRDWIAARLSLNEHECKSTLANSQDENDLEDAQRTLLIIQRLQSILHGLFPENGAHQEPSMLCHDDLSQHNILVDETGTLTGVLDWECVSAVPLWKACSYPSFLIGPNRTMMPDRSRYRSDDNGDPGSLYWEHLMEHELTLLRCFFVERMRVLQPRWVKYYESSRLQKDLDLAANCCDSEFLAPHINEWIDAVVAGRTMTTSLYDQIYTS